MRLRMLFSVGVVIAVAASAAAQAIVIRHDRDDAEYRELGERFPAVAKILPDGEGTLVGDRWVLTAAHVGRDVRRVGGRVRLGGREYEVGGVFLYPEWKGSEGDIALILLQDPVHGIEPVKLYRGRKEKGKIVTFVGQGDYGTGEAGVLRQDGVLRGATNRVESVSDAWVEFTFDAPGDGATRLEGISGPGDSGGPALLEIDGALEVIGVSSGGMNPKGSRPGTYGSHDLYTRVSSYLDWLDEVMSSGASRAGTASAPGDAQFEKEARAQADAFLQAYRSGDREALAAFVRDHMSSRDDPRPVDQRVDSLMRVRGEWGALEVLETTVEPGRVGMIILRSRVPGRRMILDLLLEDDPPYRVERIMTDEIGPGPAGESAPG